jgi:hypothetical protein
VVLPVNRKCKAAVFTRMAKKVKKRMGRPPVGSQLVGVRVPPADLAQFMAWIDRQPDPKPTLPEALRRLARKALAREAAQQGAACSAS